MKEREITNKQEFDKLLAESPNLVIDFYSTQCPPCEAFAPKFEALHALYGDHIVFAKIFRQENREIAEQRGIKSSPSVLFFSEGKPIGDMLSWGITRKDMIKNLDLLLDSPEKSAQIQASIQKQKHHYDVAIIGGGPAWLTAGLYLAQAKIKTCIIDQALPGGNVKNTHLVSNYPGFTEAQNGYMLAHHMTQQTQNAGVEFFSASTIDQIDLQTKTIYLDEYIQITANYLIIATGTSPKKLNIPGEKELFGKGISFCATCDAKYYEEKEVIVIGGGNSAIEEADFIAKFAKKITIIHQWDKLTANKEAQEKCITNPKIHIRFNQEPRSFHKEGEKISVEIEHLTNHHKEHLTTDGVFMFVGMQGNTSLCTGLELDQRGYVKTNEDKETNIPGIYAIGDVTSKKYRQITTAINDGTIAAMTIAKNF